MFRRLSFVIAATTVVLFGGCSQESQDTTSEGIESATPAAEDTVTRAVADALETIPEPEGEFLRNRYLGFGYFSSVGEVRRPVNEMAASSIDPKQLTEEGADTYFGLVASKEEFERSLRIDVEVSGGGSGWGGEASASLSEKVSRDLKSVTFVLSTKVNRGTAYLYELNPREVALTARDYPKDYLRVFGTDIIDEVQLGGSALIYFTYTFESVKEARDFEASMSGSYGAMSGSASASLSERLSQQSQYLTVTAFINGTTDLPAFFAKIERRPGGAGGVFSSEFSDNVLDQVLVYADEFPGKIEAASVNALSTVDIKWTAITDTELSIGHEKHEELEAYLDKARGVGNSLNYQENRLTNEYNKLQEMHELYEADNTRENLILATGMMEDLDQTQAAIIDRRRLLIDDGDLESGYELGGDLPEYPHSFVMSKVVKNPTWKKQAVPFNHVYEYTIPVVDPDATYTVYAGTSFWNSNHRTGGGTSQIQVIVDSSDFEVSRRGAQPTTRMRSEGFNLSETEKPLTEVLIKHHKNSSLSAGTFNFVPAEDGQIKVLVRFQPKLVARTVNIDVSYGNSEGQ